MASFLITFGINFRYFFDIDFCMPSLMPFLRLLVENGRQNGTLEISTLPILPLRSAPFSRPFPKIDFVMHVGRPLAHFWLPFRSRWLPFDSLWLTFGAFFLRRCRGSLPVSRFLSHWGRGVHAVVFIHFFHIHSLLQMSNAYFLQPHAKNLTKAIKH